MPVSGEAHASAGPLFSRCPPSPLQKAPLALFSIDP